MTADLAATTPRDALVALWKRAWLHADVPAENVERMADTFGRDVAVLDPEEVGAIIHAGGFDAPLRCFQTLMIHGWLARRSS